MTSNMWLFDHAQKMCKILITYCLNDLFISLLMRMEFWQVCGYIFRKRAFGFRLLYWCLMIIYNSKDAPACVVIKMIVVEIKHRSIVAICRPGHLGCDQPPRSSIRMLFCVLLRCTNLRLVFLYLLYACHCYMVYATNLLIPYFHTFCIFILP